MIYLLRDDFDGSEVLARLKAQFLDGGSREMNTAVLDGRVLNVDDLVCACEAPPFLADRRLVIVRRLLARFQEKEGREGKDRKSAEGTATSRGGGKKSSATSLEEKVRELIDRVPEFTDLVFVEDVFITPANPLLKSIQKAGGKIVQRAKPLKGRELVEWVRQRVLKKGGKIVGAAAEELAAFAGDDLRALDNNLDKLLIYAGDRALTLDDVRALVADTREANIFAFVDAIGDGNTRLALKELHELLYDGAAPPYVLTMIVRQFRLIIQAGEIGHSASPDDLAALLHWHPFVAQKVSRQARRFSMARLERAYQTLVAADAAMKTSSLDPAVALDMLVVDLTAEAGRL